MDKKTLFEFVAFAKRMSLMDEPFEKTWAQFTEPNRLPEPPAEVIISM